MNHDPTRRNLLKGLAAFPIISALSPAQAFAGQTPQRELEFYLWFHGLFAFIINQDYIDVLTPRVHEHCYLAGLWEQEDELKNGESYRLLGVSDPAHPDPFPVLKEGQVPFLSGVRGINTTDSFCRICLPFPKKIIPLRKAEAIFSGANAPQHFPLRKFPTVQLWGYNVVDYENLRLDPLSASVKTKRPTSIVNFHIFAEPDRGQTPHHAIAAFNQLIGLFPGVKVELKRSSASCFERDKNIPKGNIPKGLNPNQQVSLAERNGACKIDPHAGSRVANCFMVMVDARTRQ